MVDLAAVTMHTVFPVEQRGDTLIVTPRGDAHGFGVKELQGELDRILAWLDEPGIANVIIDLGSSNYYGSQIIGAINSMILKVRDRDGRSGVCEISPDMREGIKVMNLDRIWMFYDSRQAALAAIATESIGQRVSIALQSKQARIVAALSAVVLIAAVVALIMYLNRPSPEEVSRRAFDTFADIDKQLRAKRQESLPAAKWRRFAKQSTEKVEAELKELDGSSGMDITLKTALTKAGRDCLLPILKDPQKPSDELSAKFEEHMQEAKALLPD